MRILATANVLVLLFLLAAPGAYAGPEEIWDLSQEQAREKEDLEKMKNELREIKSTMSEAQAAMSLLKAEVSKPKLKEFRLAVREADRELVPGVTVRALTYNGHTPGPVIRVDEGDVVRIILHNELSTPTSLHFHGLILPDSVDGLPRPGVGYIGPGQTHTYQFVAGQPGTFWYHPQVVHAEQQARGLVGAIVVEPRGVARSYDKDYVAVISQYSLKASTLAPHAVPTHRSPSAADSRAVKAAPKAAQREPTEMGTVVYFAVNGQCAPAIPAIEVHKGERVRLRVINACQQACPLHLTGHRFEVISANGEDATGSRAMRDSLALQPGDRVDLEFLADNPGIWSLSSQLAAQLNNNGKFPGGIALVVRYLDGLAAR